MSSHKRHRSAEQEDVFGAFGDSGDSEVALLAGLARTAVDAVDPKHAALECLQSCAEALGAANGFIVLVSGDPAEGERLEIAAMVGPHAPLLGESAGLPADEETAVAAVFGSGEPSFVGSVYDGSDDASDGTARWRGLISAQATATLPLTTSTRRIGVMLLEWSQVQHFGDDLRRLLLAAARITALAMDRTWSPDAEDAGDEARREDFGATTDSSAAPRPGVPPVILGRAPLEVPEELQSGVVPVVPPAAPGESPLRFELTAEGLVIARAPEDPWGPGSVQVTMPSTQRGGLLLDVHAVGSGRALLVIIAIRGAQNGRQAELTEMLRHTVRVLAARSDVARVLKDAEDRLREFGGIGASFDGWIGVLDATNGSLTHAQTGQAGSRILMHDGRDFEGTPESPSTWLPLTGDILHAWVPGAASMRAEWHRGHPATPDAL